jgi:DNA-binding transcriptional ArsR family regulator
MKPAQVVKALAALAQDTRLAVFRLLVQAGPEGLAAGAIASRLRLPAPTASFHLAQLANASLIRSRTEGRYVFYSVDLSRMNQVLAYLTENCCGGAACDVAPARTRTVKAA